MFELGDRNEDKFLFWVLFFEIRQNDLLSSFLFGFFFQSQFLLFVFAGLLLLF